MHLRQVVWGSLFSTVGIAVIGVAISIYVRISHRFSLLYGSIGAIIVVMLWFYPLRQYRCHRGGNQPHAGAKSENKKRRQNIAPFSLLFFARTATYEFMYLIKKPSPVTVFINICNDETGLYQSANLFCKRMAEHKRLLTSNHVPFAFF